MAFLFSTSAALKRPEQKQKIIKGADFWSSQLASDIVYEAFLRTQSITHAAEVAYQSERDRGYKDGLTKAQAELAEHMIDMVNSTVSYLVKTECQFATLVYDAVKQVITDYDDKEKTMAVVKLAVSAMRGQKHIVLKVIPEKLDFVTSELKAIHEAFPAVTHIEVIGQADISDGACIVHTEIGSAETSITAQLASLKSSLHRVFGSTEKISLTSEPNLGSEESDITENCMLAQNEGG